MFNDKEITLMKRSNLEIDENGVPSYTYSNIGTYSVDVQPISADRCAKIFGVFPQVKYQVWLETKVDGFNDDTIQDFRVIYKDNTYSINQMIVWDDDWYCVHFCISKEEV